MMKGRETKLGAYPGDGPTSQQADSLKGALRLLVDLSDSPVPDIVPGAFRAASVAPDIVWYAFRAALDTEMSWLFPERDPISEPMCAALREVQNITGWALDLSRPEQTPLLERYANLAVANNAMGRQMKLHGNSLTRRVSFACRLALARLLCWLGGGEKRRKRPTAENGRP
jgi:hypothetical protein